MAGTPYHQMGSVNAATTVTIPAPGPGQCWRVNSIAFGYSATPGTGCVLTVATVEATPRTLWMIPVTSAGAGPVEPDFKIPRDTGATFTLSAGGAGVLGHLTAVVEPVF